jgi:hypothetical protein
MRGQVRRRSGLGAIVAITTLSVLMLLPSVSATSFSTSVWVSSWTGSGTAVTSGSGSASIPTAPTISGTGPVVFRVALSSSAGSATGEGLIEANGGAYSSPSFQAWAASSYTYRVYLNASYTAAAGDLHGSVSCTGGTANASAELYQQINVWDVTAGSFLLSHPVSLTIFQPPNTVAQCAGTGSFSFSSLVASGYGSSLGYNFTLTQGHYYQIDESFLAVVDSKVSASGATASSSVSVKGADFAEFTTFFIS